MPAAKKQNHEYRDEEFLNQKFGSVTGWNCPKDSVRFVEAFNCWKSDKLFIIDHMFSEPRLVSSWVPDACVVWSAVASDCVTYHKEAVLCSTEEELVQRLYNASGIVGGEVPAKPVDLVEDVNWISLRKRKNWDRAAYCMDLDAWSTTSGQPIVWDMKYIMAPGYSQTADRIIEMLGEQRKIPIYKVWYSKASGSFGDETTNKGDFVHILWGNSESKLYLGEELHGLSYAEAVSKMNEIVEKYEYETSPF